MIRRDWAFHAGVARAVLKVVGDGFNHRCATKRADILNALFEVPGPLA